VVPVLLVLFFLVKFLKKYRRHNSEPKIVSNPRRNRFGLFAGKKFFGLVYFPYIQVINATLFKKV
jgi:hypothetical protein